MKIKMRKFEQAAMEYARNRFPKKGQWAENIIAKDAFLQGFEYAMELVNTYTYGAEEVEVDLDNGDHQL